LFKKINAYRDGVSLAIVSLDGRFFVTHGTDAQDKGKLIIWKTDPGIKVREINTGSESIFFLALSPNIQWVLSGSSPAQMGSKVILWNVKKGNAVRKWKGKDGWGGPVGFTPDSKRAFSLGTVIAGEEKKARLVLWKVPSGKSLRVMAGKNEVSSGIAKAQAAFLLRGKRIIAVGRNNRVLFYDVITSKEVASVRVVPGREKSEKRKKGRLWVQKRVEAFAFSADGKRAVAVTGQNDNPGEFTLEVKVWDLEKGKKLKSWYDSTGT
jgi:WD40 repeat protein